MTITQWVLNTDRNTPSSPECVSFTLSAKEAKDIYLNPNPNCDLSQTLDCVFAQNNCAFIFLSKLPTHLLFLLTKSNQHFYIINTR